MCFRLRRKFDDHARYLLHPEQDVAQPQQRAQLSQHHLHFHQTVGGRATRALRGRGKPSRL